MARAMGLDLGEKRIGVALSDPDGRVAVPFGVVARRSDRDALRRLSEIAAAEGVGRLVVGEPLRLDGSRGAAAERAASFARKLAAATGLEAELIEETLTSVEAERRLREAGIDPRREPGRIDELAAQILLQEALDRGTGSG